MSLRVCQNVEILYRDTPTLNEIGVVREYVENAGHIFRKFATLEPRGNTTVIEIEPVFEAEHLTTLEFARRECYKIVCDVNNILTKDNTCHYVVERNDKDTIKLKYSYGHILPTYKKRKREKERERVVYI